MHRRLIALLAVLAMVMAACTTAAEDTPTTGGDGDTPATSGDGTTPDDGTTDTTGPAVLPQDEGGVLAAVQDRGAVNCGVNDAVPGFGFSTAEGEFAGFDIDFCKALAVALFGDVEAVNYQPLTAQQRFTALQSGEIDVLIRNTTWTATRDGQEGATFLKTTFYDGQALMVPASTGFTELEDLADATICVLQGTTTELNLTAVFNARGIPFNPSTHSDNETLQPAYESGQCEAWTSDFSQLSAFKHAIEEAGGEEQHIMEEIISKEPLGPVVRHGDNQWGDIVRWTLYAMLEAEEFGVTSENVDDMKANSDNPGVRRLLGVEGDMGANLGLPNEWGYNIVKQVGNYGEIFERNLGMSTPLKIERGLNALWTDGGLQYAMPVR